MASHACTSAASALRTRSLCLGSLALSLLGHKTGTVRAVGAEFQGLPLGSVPFQSARPPEGRRPPVSAGSLPPAPVPRPTDSPVKVAALQAAHPLPVSTEPGAPSSTPLPSLPRAPGRPPTAPGLEPPPPCLLPLGTPLGSSASPPQTAPAPLSPGPQWSSRAGLRAWRPGLPSAPVPRGALRPSTDRVGRASPLGPHPPPKGGFGPCSSLRPEAGGFCFAQKPLGFPGRSLHSSPTSRFLLCPSLSGVPAVPPLPSCPPGPLPALPPSVLSCARATAPTPRSLWAARVQEGRGPGCLGPGASPAPGTVPATQSLVTP